MTRAIDDQLAALQDALSLARSLAQARGPALGRAAFVARSLGVMRRSPLQNDLPANAIALEIAAAGTSHASGAEFGVVVPEWEPSAAVVARAVLLGSSVAGFSRDELPRGSSAIGVIQFPDGVPALIRDLPLADGASGPVVVWIGRSWDLDRL